MNQSLRRQLRRAGLSDDELPDDLDAWQRLLEAIGASYQDADRTRYLQERALRISSAEMQELYEHQRRTSESALGRERDLLRTVLDALEGALFSVDPDGTILFANRSAETLCGRPDHALVGGSLAAGLICETTGDSGPFVEAVQTGQSIRGANAQLLRTNAPPVPVAVNIEPLNGSLRGSVVVLRDLSDARQMTEELLKTRAHLGNLVRSAPIPFFEEDFTQVAAWLDELRDEGVTDLAAYLEHHSESLLETVSKIIILDANPAAYELLEVPEGESLVGPLDPRLFTEETFRTIVEQIQAIWDGCDTLTTEVDGVTRRGNRLVANFHWAAPRLDGEMDLSRVIVALTDITQIVESEERMRELIKSKDRFLASVSHELRTPLTAVTAAAAVLDTEYDTLEAGERKELISLLSSEAIEMAQIVEDLLVAARADMGSLTILPKRISLEREIQEVASRATSRGWRLRMGSVSGWTLADPLRVRQILRNLITNANNYGGDDVWIEASTTDGEALVTVFDDGEGVPRESWELIFEPYEQAHTSPGLPGSVGMGLAVARHLARLMGGDVNYIHEDGISRFTLTLPAAPPPA